MVWNLDDTNKKRKYNLNQIYVNLQLPVWFLATTKQVTEFLKLQTQIMYQPIMKLIFIILWCFPVSFYCDLCMSIRKLSI